jgi:plasmid maintenance system antidote protein VapI
MNLQTHYELEKTRDTAEEIIIRKVQPFAA